MKHLRLYCFITVLGIVILALCLGICYLDSIDAVSILEGLYIISTPPSSTNPEIGLCFMISGIILLTVGAVGIGRLYFKNHRNLMTVHVVFLLPLVAFATVAEVSGLMMLDAPRFPLRSEITQVTVVDTNPLVLSVDVRAITRKPSTIDGANIFDKYDQFVAECPFWRIWSDYGNSSSVGMALLPPHSEIALTLEFNVTLPSGTYVVLLYSANDNHGSAPFTIP